MGKTIKRDIPILKLMTKLKGEDFKAMVDTLQDDTVDNVCECVFNLIYNPSLKIGNEKRTKLKSTLKLNVLFTNLKIWLIKNSPYLNDVKL